MKKLNYGLLPLAAVFIILSISALFWQGCSCSGDKNSDIAEITSIEGEAKVNGQPAQKNQKLKADDIIEVDKNSVAKIKYVEEGYQFTLYSADNKSAAKLQIKSPSDDGKSFITNLIEGLITFFVPPKDQRSKLLKIQTDVAVVSIHQTKGKVLSTKEKYTAALAEGKIGVNISGTDYQIGAGQQINFDKIKKEKPAVSDYDFMSETEKKLYYRAGDQKTSSGTDGY